VSNHTVGAVSEHHGSEMLKFEMGKIQNATELDWRVFEFVSNCPEFEFKARVLEGRDLSHMSQVWFEAATERPNGERPRRETLGAAR